MFEAGKVKPIDAGEIQEALRTAFSKPFVPWWFDVLKDVRLKRSEKTLQLIGLLFYMSPWLQRWRGTQLPIEMIIGEAGSGKSSIYMLRLGIIHGEPILRNAPQDLRDWYAGVTSAGGLHVTDNVQMVDKNLKQRMSDEMCRIVTEPYPHIELRKFYTEADLVRIPVQTLFGMTAINQPFHNVDLLQRSVVIELDKGESDVEYDSQWAQNQMARFGGRVAWVAHQLHALHRFLKLVSASWSDKYRSKHRLVNLEQTFMLMAQACGIPNDWIVQHLQMSTVSVVSESDWAFEGLCEYAKQSKKGMNGTELKFSAGTIAAWAEVEEEFAQCVQLTNVRSLGRYMQTNKQMLAQVAGIISAGTSNNKAMFTLKTPPKVNR